MDSQYLNDRRSRIYNAMEPDSILLCYAGVPLHTNEDEYHSFEVNSQFFYLTGLQWPNQAFFVKKAGEQITEYLFIEESDPFTERWTGKMPTKEDCASISGIASSSIHYITSLNAFLSSVLNRYPITYAYFDVSKNNVEDLPDYNLLKANEFSTSFPSVKVQNLHHFLVPFRTSKDSNEITCIKNAISITEAGLKTVMQHLKPGLREYQVQAVFEGFCKYQGATAFSFPTIAGSGKNACSMHYVLNQEEIRDGDLLLLDLGAKFRNYCSDITRTYPANGHFTERQRTVYNLVLRANREVVKAAKPGITLRELNDLTKKILAEGLISLGLIESEDQVGKYYMHSVSHSLGIDAHDAAFADMHLKPGWVISDEPGLYIDEEGIGIRIEDDLLITEDGCICLSESIIRDPDAIEQFMQSQKTGA